MIRPSRKVLAYALAIAVPTMALLVLGLLSVRRQQQAIGQLESANRRLQAEQAASTLATRVAAAAARCLRDEGWRDVLAGEAVAPGALRAIARRHPVARQLLVVRDGELLYPRTSAPLDLDLDEDDAGCRPTIAAAERAEFGGRPQEAVRLYTACLRTASTSGARALLLARLARAERARGHAAQAIEAYVTLAARHADDHDRFSRPFGLIAPIELYDLQPGRHVEALRQARADLLGGRWNLTDEQARYFLEELGVRIGAPPAEATPAPFLEALDVAQAIQSALPLEAAGTATGVVGEDVPLSGRRTRIHHALVSGPTSRAQALVVPDAAWIERVALPAALREAGASGDARLLLDDPAQVPGGVLVSAEGLAPWRLWVAPVRQDASARLPVLLQGAITLLVSGVLGLGVLLLVRDVRREQALAQMRSQFVSAASHELRTPLAMILLYAQTLLEDVDADREERRGSYEIIAQESERLRHLLDKVLDFSRIDGGRRSYRFEARDLDESVAAAVRLIEPQLLRRGFTLEQDVRSVPDVRHDPEAITGAVLNLLENAAKYSGDSRWIGLRVDVEGEEASIAVRDQGIGIPSEDLPRIGERFFRTARSSSIGGYGLGLFLVSHAMAAHGGRLEVTSSPGEGSTFTLVMPRSGAPDTEEGEA